VGVAGLTGINPIVEDKTMNSSVYKVQCKTFRIAKKLLGISAKNLVLACDIDAELKGEFNSNPLFYFRAKKKFRSHRSQALRNEVASYLIAYRSYD
jgi:hypothetical protein